MKLFLEILKKNVVLAVTLVLSVLASCVLLVFALGMSGRIREFQNTLDSNIKKLQDKAQGVSATNPGPVQANIDNIKTDTSKVKAKVDSIRMIFGMPYCNAFKAFAEALGESEMQLLNRWRDVFRREIRKNNLPRQIFIAELSKLDPEKLQTAKAAFKDVMLKESSVEPLDDVDDYILDAIGVPREMTSENCKRYIGHMSDGLQGILKSKDIGKGLPISTGTSVSFIIFDRLALESQVPYIVKNYKLIEDLLVRMKKAGISDVSTLSRTSILEGEVDKDYLYLSYKLDVLGSMESIREFCNILLDAHADNRVYIIKNIKLSKLNNEVQKLIGATTAVPAKPDPKAVPQPSAPGGSENSGILLGGSNNDLVKAEIDISYVIFIGDEIRK